MSMITKVINIHVDGFPEGGVYIGRKGKGHDGYFGNPFRITKFQPRHKSILNYEMYFTARMRTDTEFERRINELAGKTLVCFCKPLLCHGDIIAKYLNEKYFASLADEAEKGFNLSEWTTRKSD